MAGSLLLMSSISRCNNRFFKFVSFVLFGREGTLTFLPNSSELFEEKYEGHWVNGKMAGYGKMR